MKLNSLPPVSTLNDGVAQLEGVTRSFIFACQNRGFDVSLGSGAPGLKLRTELNGNLLEVANSLDRIATQLLHDFDAPAHISPKSTLFHVLGVVARALQGWPSTARTVELLFDADQAIRTAALHLSQVRTDPGFYLESRQELDRKQVIDHIEQARQAIEHLADRVEPIYKKALPVAVQIWRGLQRGG